MLYAEVVAKFVFGSYDRGERGMPTLPIAQDLELYYEDDDFTDLCSQRQITWK
jgi:hypothetical protein